MSKTKLTSIILAAGVGSRMKSDLPKVLHRVGGKPMVQRVIEAVRGVDIKDVRVVIGYKGDLVRRALNNLEVDFFVQEQQLGSGHGAGCAIDNDMQGSVLIINGDHPLVSSKSLQKVISEYSKLSCDLAIVSVQKDVSSQFGRIVRSVDERFIKIVEASDATSEQMQITECNSGVYIINTDNFKHYIGKLDKNNAQKEYYLTDIASMMAEDGLRVEVIEGDDSLGIGINSQEDLAEIDSLFSESTKVNE